MAYDVCIDKTCSELPQESNLTTSLTSLTFSFSSHFNMLAPVLLSDKFASTAIMIGSRLLGMTISSMYLFQHNFQIQVLFITKIVSMESLAYKHICTS
jgi:hypothetical protein